MSGKEDLLCVFLVFPTSRDPWAENVLCGDAARRHYAWKTLQKSNSRVSAQKKNGFSLFHEVGITGV